MDKGEFAQINGIRMHYLDNKSKQPPLLLLHSLSANAYIFQGLIANGLNQHFRLIIPDLRGRGLSEHTLAGYSLEEESRDLVALLDTLGIEKVTVGGHSFGGLLALYFAAHYPQRVRNLIVLDAAVSLNPLTPFLITYATARLLREYPSWDSYLELVRKAPFMNLWDASMLPFLRNDIKEGADGLVSPRNNWIDIAKAASHVLTISDQQWRKYVSAVCAPTLLIHAADPFVHGQHIVTPDKVLETVALLRRGEDLEITGNHITMLFGKGAGQITSAIQQFAKEAVASAALLA